MNNPRYSIPESRETAVDAGLQAYMQRVYNVMAAGLVVTGLVAYFVSTSPMLVQAIHGTWLGLIVIFSPLVILFFGLTPERVQRMSVTAVSGLYFGITALIGLSLSYIFLAYTSESIARVFFITAGMFAAMSIYGYTTRRDLTAFGSFLFMGLIGLILAMVVNWFLQSAMLQFVISGAGVLIFTGMTAWDTQRIKEQYHVSYASVLITPSPKR